MGGTRTSTISRTRTARPHRILTHPHIWPTQLRLAQVSHELHDRISATPRYEALSELKEHCSIDLSKEWSLLSPAERLFKKPPRFGPRVNRREIDLTMPIPQVCSARSLSPGPDYRELSVSCARAAPRLHMLHYVTLGRVLGMRV